LVNNGGALQFEDGTLSSKSKSRNVTTDTLLEIPYVERDTRSTTGVTHGT
jgi:hypothetical protein